ncbi:MAG: hypothetical protein SFY96_07890 [Planctomycetota bacterium]|nr:hypothetical protein [Planctomycetota bacterium]
MNRLARLNLSVGLLLAASALTLPGCIIVADNSGYERNPRNKVSWEEANKVQEISSVSTLPTVRDKYADALSRLQPGMSVDAFKAAIPAATFVEQRKTANGTQEAYSVVVRQQYRYRGERYVYDYSDEAWFYFSNGGFAKWGKPGQWPEN